MNNCPIGIFDSGIGGLSVFSELFKIMPEENYLYFGDTKNLPYGDKSKDELITFTKNIFDFLQERNVKAVVMACNTTSAVAYDILKDKYDFKIYPIVQCICKNIAQENYKKIGVFATYNTVKNHAYKNELQKYNPDIEVIELACPNWVNIVENSLKYELFSIGNIKLQLNKMLEYNPEKIILGCTHYPYLTDILSSLSDKELFINPAVNFALDIYKDLQKADLLNTHQDFSPKFYVSSNPEQFIIPQEILQKINNNQKIIPIKITL